jgi:hypothetical protein
MPFTEPGDLAPKNQSPKAEKGRRPNRQQTKEQITVRMDRDLLGYLRARAEDDGLRLTDELENAVSIYLKTRRASEFVLRGRFLWQHLPLRLQKLTMSFWGFITDPREDAVEVLRKFFEDFLWTYQDDIRCQQAIERLSKSKETEEE